MLFNKSAFFILSFLALLLSLYLFFKKTDDKLANRLIALYTLFFSYEMFINCLKWQGSLATLEFVHFNLAHAPAWLLYGPIMFLYVKRKINNKGLESNDFYLFIPACILFLLISPFYFINAEEKLNIVLNKEIYNYAIFPSYAIWIVITLMFFYGFFTIYKFKNQKNVGYKELSWLKWFVGSYIGLVSLFSIYVFLVRFKIMDPKYDYFIDSGIIFFIILLIYFSRIQPDIFNGTKSIKQVLLFNKYQKTGLSEALSKDLRDNLIKLMNEDKPYLKNNLRLNDIAKLLKVSRNHASQVINEHFNLSFFDFVNKYRVEEAKKLLLEYKKDDLNINQIAYSVGFNNRASFYKAFKKFANKTPTTYAKHLKVS